MKTKTEIREEIAKLEHSYKHVLTGKVATVVENAPRALMQLGAETSLKSLYWVLGEEFKSKLK